MQKLSVFLLVLLLLSVSGCKKQDFFKTPNIVIIYADDMGYGDLNIQNLNSKIPTPNLDQLAREGMRFTDAHSSSGICSPSRYALLTGTYHWRRQHGIVGSFGKPFFNNSDITLPQVLRNSGYTTACIGKWHLGWNWEIKDSITGKPKDWNQYRNFPRPTEIDWSKPISGGPLDRGFDYYFGDGTINFPPYAWVENDKILVPPTEIMNPKQIGYEVKKGHWEFRPGPKVKDWNPYEVLPTLTQKVKQWIQVQDSNKPFFLYFALPSPHAPIIPNDEFDGKSQAGPYGDYAVQTDYVVGEVLKTLKEQGLEENTIIIFSSDNGPEHYAWDRALNYNHFSMGDYRGLKRDVWEGGHHVPFIMKWPNKIKAGSVSNELVSQIDLMATLANITGATLPANAAPDSYDLSKLLKGDSYDSPLREGLVHNTYASIWGIRKGEWLFINDSTGGHRKMPESFMKIKGYQLFNTEGLLFNMKNDPEQRNNLYNSYPEKIKELQSLLKTYQDQGYSVSRKNKSTSKLN
ncbi:sulfatase family protein [Aestuariibaculum sediminum]|uniref:Arylsulfatase n=1 Tax=Aestuariibaculum sediminum TaxID=2770637 RepID=A0A8J6Q2C4_9FLAO|nr:arylsulfatase [Aestuariibaculum sediminum]MBD0831979.1 arylsulfatase [Aestuariibaculum sediminum]